MMMTQMDARKSGAIKELVQPPVGAAEARRKQPDNWPPLEVTISNLLHLMHIPVHIKGYHYLRKAILLEVERQEAGGISAKVLFPKVAKHFGATPDKVDRGIRYALATAWKQCDFSGLTETHGITFRFSCDKPTNLEFIAYVADYYRLQTGS